MKIAPLAIFAVLASLFAAPAFAAFCTGKQNGLWCDGNNLVNCQGGAQASSKSCPSGCQSNPVGVADACKSASGPCSGKQNGAWCDGSNLNQCKDGAVASSQGCQYGCQSMPTGVPDVCKGAPAPSGPCSGKADGTYCDGSKLLQCKSGNVASSQACPNGCEVKPPGTPDVCKAATASGPCTGKPDGGWCSGDALLQCKGGNQSGSQTCSYGCQAMPPGVADQCKSAPSTSGPCTGKADGKWCDGDKLLTCGGGKATGSTSCSDGCQSMANGVPDQCKPPPAANGPCTGKADGGFCDGATLRICKGGQQVGSQLCALSCQDNACEIPPFDPNKACAGKQNGLWCVGKQLAQCKGGAVAGASNCPDGCQAMPSGVPDTCKKSGGDPACAGKADGTYCVGSDLVQCSNSLIAKGLSCTKGCAQPAAGGAACKVKSTGFCSGKANGSWCDGPLLTNCQGGAASGVFACPGGCQQNSAGVADACKPAATPSNQPVASGSASTGESGGCATFAGGIDLWQGKGLKVWNQKDFSEQLGTCPGLTIHNSGCTITSLAMLHAYLGIQRSVDGENGNTPIIENKWRKQFGGYAASTYDMGGKQVSGKCLVIWGSAPSGLVPAHGKNDSSSCITPKAAAWMVNALKSGMPIVTGVHWAGSGGEDSHWVLMVGIDQGGPIINDPWGGKERVHLSDGGLGKYIIDDMYVFWQAGQQQGGMAPAPLDQDGEPTTEDALPKTLQYIDDTPPLVAGADAGAAQADAGVGADGAADAGAGADAVAVAKPAAGKGDSGCAAGAGAGSTSWLALFAMLGWWWPVRTVSTRKCAKP